MMGNVNFKLLNRLNRCVIKSVKVGNVKVEEKQNSKLLGITIGNNNSMVEHIKKICKQASNKLNALARISPALSENKRKVLNKSFVTSQFSYCPIIWMYCQHQSNNLINRIHERALRLHIRFREFTKEGQICDHSSKECACVSF